MFTARAYRLTSPPSPAAIAAISRLVSIALGPSVGGAIDTRLSRYSEKPEVCAGFLQM
jgi:hypothetical protein